MALALPQEVRDKIGDKAANALTEWVSRIFNNQLDLRLKLTEEKSSKDMVTLESRLEKKIGSVESGLKAEIQGVQSEMQGMNASLRSEMQGMNASLKLEIANTKVSILKWQTTQTVIIVLAILGAKFFG